MTPNAIVRRFATLTANCLDLLLAEYVGLEKTSVAQRAVLLRRDGAESEWSGPLGSVGRFMLHGRGCRFELDSGEDLDVDWASDGTAEFDTWKILMFARSVGEGDVDRDALRAGAEGDPILMKVRDDWFTWADRNYNLRREPGS